MSSTNVETVGQTQSELRNRLDPKKETPATNSKRSAEEILIEKLDAFLSSIELRLDRFDQYFKVSADGLLTDEIVENDAKTPGSRSVSRRSSLASLSSLKSFSMYNLNMMYEQLSMVKDQVLKTSVLNLDYLYKALDDKYNALFNQDGEFMTAEVPLEQTLPSYRESLSNNSEILTNKIITNLTYFEQKLSHIDALIKSRTPQATPNYDEDAKFNRFRFFNFNRALKAAQHDYLHYYQLPLLWRENRYIIHGYRFNLSHREMLKSMFHFNHNETVNIWTHILGALAICYLGLVHFPNTDVFQKNFTTGNAMMLVFLLAAFECLVSSVLWHTYSCFAQLKIRNRFACVDYTGITVLITCLVVAAEYCSLYNYPKLLSSFMAILVVSGVAGFMFNWSPYFDRPDCRPFRIGFFLSLAFLGGTTFLCRWYYEGLVNSFYFYCPLIYKSFVWYWLGVVFYGGLIPERWRYDIIINEDDTCGHEHSALEVIMGNIEHSGEEELREVRATLAEHCRMHGCCPGELPDRPAHTHAGLHSDSVASVDSDPTSGGDDACQQCATCTCTPDAAGALDDETIQKNDILKKHFPEMPLRTPYHKDFLSLWWVDYILQSHNIWHVCVVLGVVGHYFCLLTMFEDIHLHPALAS